MKRWATLAATVVALIAMSPAAEAVVLVSAPPRNAFCLDRIKIGVWYQSFSGGSRRYRVSVYNPAGNLILDKRGLAATRWRYFYFRPIGFKGSVAGIHKTRVYCGE